MTPGRARGRRMDAGGRLRAKGAFPAALLLLLLVAAQVAPAGQAAGAPSVPLNNTVSLREYSYRGYQIDAFANSTSVSYAASSDSPVSAAIMTAAQYGDWEANLSDPISNSLASQNGTQVQGSASVGPGEYFLVFYAYYSRAFVEFGYQTDPSTPFSYGPLSPPLGMGLASFGILNESGTVSAYQVRTPEIAGAANVSSVQVDTPDAQSYGASTSGFSLQLNAMLVVNDGAGGSEVYWVQDVPEFVTGGSTVSFADEVWNASSPTATLSNSTITSINADRGGYVYDTGASRFSSGRTLYAYSLPNATYALPFDFGVLMSEAVAPGTGVVLQLGYRVYSNGTAGSGPVEWFDDVTIHDPSAASAYFLVSGSRTPPIGLYYDAEFVFAGEGNLEPAIFTQLDASLGLFYQNGTSLVSFPSYYGFSGDTGESAVNLVETYSDGIVTLSPGAAPTYPYLGGASLTLPPGSAGGTGGSTGQETTGKAPGAGGATGGYVVAGVTAAAVAAAALVVFVITRLGPSRKEGGDGTDGRPPDFVVPPYA